jgi:hypothetical protein
MPITPAAIVSEGVPGTPVAPVAGWGGVVSGNGGPSGRPHDAAHRVGPYLRPAPRANAPVFVPRGCYNARTASSTSVASAA